MYDLARISGPLGAASCSKKSSIHPSPQAPASPQRNEVLPADAVYCYDISTYTLSHSQSGSNGNSGRMGHSARIISLSI